MRRRLCARERARLRLGRSRRSARATRLRRRGARAAAAVARGGGFGAVGGARRECRDVGVHVIGNRMQLLLSPIAFAELLLSRAAFGPIRLKAEANGGTAKRASRCWSIASCGMKKHKKKCTLSFSASTVTVKGMVLRVLTLRPTAPYSRKGRGTPRLVAAVTAEAGVVVARECVVVACDPPLASTDGHRRAGTDSSGPCTKNARGVPSGGPARFRGPTLSASGRGDVAERAAASRSVIHERRAAEERRRADTWHPPRQRAGCVVGDGVRIGFGVAVGTSGGGVRRRRVGAARRQAAHDPRAVVVTLRRKAL